MNHSTAKTYFTALNEFHDGFSAKPPVYPSPDVSPVDHRAAELIGRMMREETPFLGDGGQPSARIQALAEKLHPADPRHMLLTVGVMSQRFIMIRDHVEGDEADEHDLEQIARIYSTAASTDAGPRRAH